ncbi:MAG TPA: TolC family protein [Candidatus Eisenbacteria bacterium]|nr:TolC family protein [Candidatus Eisenbacteria bacterium]
MRLFHVFRTPCFLPFAWMLSLTLPEVSRAESLAQTDSVADLTLEAATQLVLAKNPSLVALNWEVQAKEAEMRQAGSRPNPELTAELENALGSGNFDGLESSETTVGITQALELGGKRGKRRDAADAAAKLTQSERTARRLAVLRETQRRFTTVLAAQEHVAAAEDLVDILESTLEDVSRRVAAGGASPVEESRARVALQSGRVDLDRVRRTLVWERQRLAALWGTSTPDFLRARGDLGAIKAPPEWAALASRVPSSPELRQRELEVDLRRASLAVERSLGIPNVSVGAGMRWLNASDDRAFVFGVGLPLPLFDRNQSAALAAAKRVSKSEAELAAAKVELETELARAYQEVSAAHAEAVSLRDLIIPEAEKAFTTSREAFRQGLLRLTDVLDTERTLFELKDRHVDSLTRYHNRVADLEELLGGPLESAIEEDEK